MATKRRTRTIRQTIIPPALRYYLETGTYDKSDEAGSCEVFLVDDDKLIAAWESCRDELLREFIKRFPGTRPWAWWSFEGPRQDTGSGAFFEPLPVPRERIGGKGETTCEVYPAIVPHFVKGIPASWAFIDLEFPPTYESEAAYLDRHGLLTPVEKRYLEKHPELLEPEKITIGGGM